MSEQKKVYSLYWALFNLLTAHMDDVSISDCIHVHNLFTEEVNIYAVKLSNLVHNKPVPPESDEFTLGHWKARIFAALRLANVVDELKERDNDAPNN